MAHFREFIDPNFLCNLDFLDDNGRYKRKTVTVKSVTKEEIHNGKGSKDTVATVHTTETKPFVLSNINMKTIVRMSRKVDTNDWVGMQIELYIEEGIKAFGKMHDVIRVSPKIIKTEPKQDYTKQIALLRTAKTLDELKQLFTSLSKSEQAACVAVKDEMKGKLTPNENN
jgi:hypothetical protein